MDKKDSKRSEETAQSTIKAEKSLDKEISDLFGPWLEKNKIAEAICIVQKPDDGKYVIFYRGHFYDVAKLLTQVLRNFKSEIASELSD